MRCPECGCEFAEGAKFCPNCGRPVESAGDGAATGATARQEFCPVCGSPIAPGAKFCPSCGWQVGSPAKKSKVTQAAEGVASKVNQAIGYNDHVEVKFKEFFVAVPKHHSHVEAERLLTCGTPETTPGPSDITAVWPRPWVYSRVFVVLLATLLLDVALVSVYGNPLGMPSLMFLGAALMPVTVLVFFFETNVPRNVSFATTLEILFVGGMASLLAIYFNPLLAYSDTGEIGPSLVTGLVEEVAKAVVTIVVLSRMKDRRYVLNGLLVGAAVGAGFDMFETAGYVYEAAMESGFDGAIASVIDRAPTALGAHVAWAAAEGGAFVLCYGEVGFSWRHVADKRFLGILCTCIVLHGIWDSFIADSVFDFFLQVTGSTFVATILGYALLTIAIWIVIDVLLNRGLKQVNEVAAGQP